MSNKPKFPSELKTVSRVFAKPALQGALKDLRANGFNVTKVDGGYTVTYDHVSNGEQLMLKAMNGARGYLVRMVDGLLVERDTSSDSLTAKV